MPGIVVFKRRWWAGSDDFVLPVAVLVFLHLLWLIAFVLTFSLADFKPSAACTIGHVTIKNYILGYIVIIGASVFLEGIMFLISLRGSILEVHPRASMQYLLYLRLVFFLFDLSWQVIGVVWLALHYNECEADVPKKVVIGAQICNWSLMLAITINIWCVFDSAGKKWVKMKRFQESLKGKQHRKRQSGRRNWRQRKAIRAYEESWDRRFNLLCCCIDTNRNRNSIAEIAKLFTEFFRDLDVVPSDVIAGLVLLRRYQSIRMRHFVSQGSNDIYEYLSGVPITPKTEFLQLGQPDVLEEFKKVNYYMRYAMAAYGWPGYMMIHTSTGLCKIAPGLRCCCCQKGELPGVVGDNCCSCNLVGLLRISGLTEQDLIYATYHVDVGETPFYVAVDHKYRKVVICVRGTTSLQDVLTDLKADAEVLPLDPPREGWLGHQGMLMAAVYIRNKLKEDMILAHAFGSDPDMGTASYDLVLVGHSLGAGTAAILAILLRQEYPNLHCYSFSPPGGLLSAPCVEETKPFITSCVVGKDIVPRIGLAQLEVLRADLINVIKDSKEPKWKIIMRALCCGNKDAHRMKLDDIHLEVERNVHAHPSDSQIALSSHTPLYPPGKIIHVVRSHPSGKGKSSCCKKYKPVYQAIWADNCAFDQVLVSPTMINDHMPDNVMDALEKVLHNVGPPKPTHTLTEAERKALLEERSPSSELDQPKEILTDGQGNSEVQTAENQALPRFIYEHVNEELVMSLDDEGNVIFTGSKQKPKLILDLESKDPVEAPLASPETISERSSMAGSVSQGSGVTSNRDSYRQSVQSPMLETIQHSPVNKTCPKAFNCDTVERDSENLCSNQNCLQNGESVTKGRDILTRAVVERVPIEECERLGIEESEIDVDFSQMISKQKKKT
ncbi:hypothetical protein FSP39_022580 [Pinctada imbricata]|uniref:Diacylglycerol lipase-alpha n=1 Tax=Pinctada imbricata TaxID=66713 RepID=A0AA88Y5Y3_PINIB|nr:hypothetical protein FSP39_022580 [Pinctada imbricata]